MGGVWGGGTILACIVLVDSGQFRCKRPISSMFKQQKTLDRLEDRLQRVENLCADREREHRKLDMEFTDLYDKVKRQMSRMAKRYAVDQKENGELLEADPDNSSSDSVDPISEAIHARRNRGYIQQ